MTSVKKDLATRLLEVLGAWRKMRSHKQFFGMGVDTFEQRAKPFLDARDEIADLEEQVAHAVSKRDAAAVPLLDLLQGIVSAVKGDPEEGQNGEFYSAMGYVLKNQRSTGLVRRPKGEPPIHEGGGSGTT